MLPCTGALSSAGSVVGRGVVGSGQRPQAGPPVSSNCSGPGQSGFQAVFWASAPAGIARGVLIGRGWNQLQRRGEDQDESRPEDRLGSRRASVVTPVNGDGQQAASAPSGGRASASGRGATNARSPARLTADTRALRLAVTMLSSIPTPHHTSRFGVSISM